MATLTRIYDTYAHARNVVRELETAGVPSSDISLLANKHVSADYADVEDVSATGAGAGIGAALGGGAGLLAGLGLMAIPGLGPVVAAGWLASTALGAVAGAAAGGLIGGLVDLGVPERHAHVYAESLRRGATMVVARVNDALHGAAQSIMDRHMPIDVNAREEEYRKQGWKKFDPKAAPYKPTEAEIERMRRDL